MTLGAHPLLLPRSGTALSTYAIPKSLRFRGGGNAWIARAPTVAGNMRQWTWSGWVKRGQMGRYQVIFGAHDNVNNDDGHYHTIGFGADDTIGVSLYSAWLRKSARVLRDKHAWYHVVVAYDTPNADVQKRCRIWLNGEEITTWSTNTTITQNIQHGINWTQSHCIGKVNFTSTPAYLDGLVANVQFIDGQVLDASAFGQFDPRYDQWVAKEYTGTYGTNGFWLDFNTDWTPGAVISGWSSPSVYATPGNYSWVLPANIYDLQGSAWGAGGGGGAGANPAQGIAPSGGASSFYGGNFIAYGGQGGYTGYTTEGAGGVGGVPSGAGDLTLTGGAGVVSQSLLGGQGGAGANGGAGGPSPNAANTAGLPGSAPGGGGSGAGGYLTQGGGGGGGGGAFIQKVLSKAAGQLVPGNTFYLTVGAGGAGAPGAGTSVSKAGGPGANGQVSLIYRTQSGGTLQVGLGDKSGNDNHFSQSGIRTDGVWNDFLNDSPTDNVPPVSGLNGGYTDYWGGTVGYNPNASWGSTAIPVVIPPGKWFMEGFVLTTTGAAYAGLGVRPDNNITGVEYVGDKANSFGVIAGPTALTAYTNNVQSGAISRDFTAGAAMALAIDTIAGKCWVGGGNALGGYSWIGGGNPDAGTSPTFTFTPGTYFYPAVSMYANTTHWNVGHVGNGWTTLKPVSFKWFRTSNFEDPTILLPKKHFKTKTWTGNGAIRKIDLDFDPDLVWIKHRSGGGAYSHNLYDRERGSFNLMASNDAATQSNNPNSLDFGTSLGYTLGSLANINALGDPFVGWAWDDGALPGFDVLKYIGNSVQDRAIPHSLGKHPFMMIVKPFTDFADSWRVWHWAASQAGDSGPRHMLLNTTGGWTSPATNVFSRIPDATNIYLGNNPAANGQGYNYVAYVWSEVPGFSKFGWYNGNARGDDGSVFCPCGFRPAYVMIKRVDSSGDWIVYDNARDPANVVLAALLPNSPSGDLSSVQCDFLANGFKLRRADHDNNIAGGRYVFMAFAEAPYKYANAR